MPKETIETKNADCLVKVGWSSDPETATSIQVAVAVPGLAVNGVEYKDVWAHLDREQAKQYIRTLKRAWDASFGVDSL